MDWVPMNDLSRSVSLHREELLADLVDTLDSGWFLLGPRTTAFAAELAAYLDVPHVVPVGNGTDALEIALKALMPDGRTTVLCAANAGGYGSVAARRAGFAVSYADVDPATHCLDPDDLAARISDEVGVVIVTHLYGRAAEVDRISEAAHAVGALVLEDCAQALGGLTPAGRVGSLADAATFSFYPTKNLGALGDGGAVATSFDEVAERVRRLHQYGWDTKYRIADDGGRNSRLDELQAAVLSRRLPLLDDWNSARRSVISAYADAAPDGVRVLPAADEGHTGHLAVVEADDRDALRAHLEAARVRTDVHYPTPDHQQPGLDGGGVVLPVTERLSTRVLSVPVFPELRPDEISRVGEALASFRP
ncbi:dTDP-4-amino-4,6-dideoxygalactose transaminase [Nocardioides sp. BE266]|uniref:DegT/DnrJ/EryC1/StrS family aminotransferase n=1 Tax=Nocardioides sp. BE266 TaxID=2817725 RepID=UPI0028604E1D|nr:DegT/DnrJ/EryC1/StrS family aminotransferase [Nocardioides sp. BE266]MDR7252143.1 dTDP-4-amino-4,6-dideoxygalactose transaminase [Nocardioides sp. BE266]